MIFLALVLIGLLIYRIYQVTEDSDEGLIRREMYCPSCGRPVERDFALCPYCGRRTGFR